MSIFREIFNAIIRMFTWLVVIAPWEQAVRVRLGKHVRILIAGVHLRIPFIDRIYRQSIRRRITLLGMQTLTTKDDVAVTISGAVGYEIVDLLKLYQTLHDADDTIAFETLGLISSFVITHNLADCRAESVQEYVVSKMNLESYGLGKQEFFLTGFAVVKTYRLLQGGVREWKAEPALMTTEHEGQRASTG